MDELNHDESRGGDGDDFERIHLVPSVSASWSSSAKRAWQYWRTSQIAPRSWAGEYPFRLLMKSWPMLQPDFLTGGVSAFVPSTTSVSGSSSCGDGGGAGDGSMISASITTESARRDDGVFGFSSVARFRGLITKSGLAGGFSCFGVAMLASASVRFDPFIGKCDAAVAFAIRMNRCAVRGVPSKFVLSHSNHSPCSQSSFSNRSSFPHSTAAVMKSSPALTAALCHRLIAAMARASDADRSEFTVLPSRFWRASPVVSLGPVLPILAGVVFPRGPDARGPHGAGLRRWC
jgi:hypothetical protein